MSKSIFVSKTFWFAVATFGYGGLVHSLDQGIFSSDVAVWVNTVVVPTVMLVLRKLTSQPVHIVSEK